VVILEYLVHAQVIPSCHQVCALMAKDGDNDLGFTSAQQEWIRCLVDSEWDANAQCLSSSSEPALQ